ncbi:hypothetical protein CONPUDRAFT_62229, partial [Coniophora puteana RWD-64-598 SS2]
AQAQAWNILINVSKSGNFEERHSVLDRQLKAGVLQLCSTTLYHRVLLFSRLASQLLAQLCRQSFLSERLSPRDTGAIIHSLCSFALQDSDGYSDQLIDPAKQWQWSFSELSAEDPWCNNDELRCLMARRLFGEAQLYALDYVRILLSTDRTSSSKRLLQVIKQTPTIIDLLLDCMILEPPYGFPDSVTSSLACEALCALFKWSPDAVPGVPPVTTTACGAGEARALGQSLQFLTSQDNWVDRLVEAWAVAEKCSFAAAETLYRDEESTFKRRQLRGYTGELASAFCDTGCSRISILRLITTLTHFADATGVKNVDLYPLLTVAYQASFKIDDEKERHRTQDICNWPSWALLTMDRYGYIDPFHVAPERVLGPTAFARLLVILAHRNALNNTQFLHKAPESLSPVTSLTQIQQMTHPDVIRRFLTISLYRAKDHIEEAMYMESKEVGKYLPRSSVIFNGTAELAAAIVAFADLTGDAYTSITYRARLTLVTALGSLSQTAIQMGQYKRAYSWSMTALDMNQKSPPKEKISDFLVKGCKRVARDAKRAIDSR